MSTFKTIIFVAGQCLELNVGKPESDRDWVAGMAKPRLQLGRGGGGEIEVDGNVNIQMHFKIQMKKMQK